MATRVSSAPFTHQASSTSGMNPDLLMEFDLPQGTSETAVMPQMWSALRTSMGLVHSSHQMFTTTNAQLSGAILEVKDAIKNMDRSMSAKIDLLCEHMQLTTQACNNIGAKIENMHHDMANQLNANTQKIAALQAEFISLRQDLAERLPGRLASMDQQLTAQAEAVDNHFKAQKEYLDNNFQLIMSHLSGSSRQRASLRAM